MKLVIDASVAAKWIAPEADSLLAERLLDEQLCAPDLLYAEVANILWKKQQRAEMDAEAARIGASWLLQVPLEVHDAAGLMEDAVALSRQLQHPAYDCFYLALSRRLDAPLITADKRLHAVLQMGRAVVLGKLVRTLGTFDA